MKSTPVVLSAAPISWRRVLAMAGVLFAWHGALAANSANGKRIAQARCAGCHIVVPHQREELAKSPPFETIARKYGFDEQMIAAAIRNPHAGMNVTVSTTDAADIAAYIATLGR
jgi:mono/diheme cytochrome c family protein